MDEFSDSIAAYISEGFDVEIKVDAITTRHRGSTSRVGLVHLESGGERLVAYLDRRTPWDS